MRSRYCNKIINIVAGLSCTKKHSTCENNYSYPGMMAADMQEIKHNIDTVLDFQNKYKLHEPDEAIRYVASLGYLASRGIRI